MGTYQVAYSRRDRMAVVQPYGAKGPRGTDIIGFFDYLPKDELGRPMSLTPRSIINDFLAKHGERDPNRVRLVTQEPSLVH